jgi:NADP-dependent 3-hydroxy acid dehydrogenase YdfG
MEKTLKRRSLIVLGADSSIAQFVVPKLISHFSNTISISRSGKPIDWAGVNLKVDLTDEKGLISSIHQTLGSDDALVTVLNFTGYFGKVASFDNTEIVDILDANSKNLALYFSAAKLLSTLPPDSVLISFCGGGVGGANLDDSSLGYLSAKASISIINEAINNQLGVNRLYSALISPGAFPSRMQDAVAQASEGDIPTSRIEASKDISLNVALLENLVELILWVVENPKNSGGRLFSAAFDLPLPSLLTEHFGKIRRVY